jgi:uncharacterized protein (TIGR01777 family)
MKIVLAGGTGFLGRALARSLSGDGHDVVLLSRGAGARPPLNRARAVAWVPNGAVGEWASELDGAEAVVNLAGESLAAPRWTEAHKRRVLESRVAATRSLVAAIRGAGVPPRVFISGSAVGYYGPLGDQSVAEDGPPGSDFLAQVCVQWEAEAAQAAGDRTRVVAVRTGLALEKDGGALPRMLPPFRFGAGGRIGSGRQYWPWIHRADWVAMVRWAMTTPAVAGAMNATAPNPVANAEFARALGRALHRPAFMPTPGFALKLLLGEMAEALLLSGQRAIPAKAERGGFTFRYPRLDDALRAIFAA